MIPLAQYLADYPEVIEAQRLVEPEPVGRVTQILRQQGDMQIAQHGDDSLVRHNAYAFREETP